MKRVSILSRHLCSSSTEVSSSPSREEVFSMLEDRTQSEDRLRLLHQLPGPFQHLGKDGAILAVSRASLEGKVHEFWYDWSVKSGGPGTNIVFPTTFVPKGDAPYIDVMVCISNPKDAQRMAHLHVRKAHTYGIAFLGDGVLATRDIDSWKEQRAHLQEALLPIASLAKVFDTSKERARYAAEEKLMKMADNGKAKVEINEFLLYEAMAQLQLTLLGETEAKMDETNVPLRQAFKSALYMSNDIMEAAKTRSKARRVVHGYSNDVVARAFSGSGCPMHAGPTEVLRDSGCPVQGPLMARIADVSENPKIKRDNASTFLFAGHDTTANLMTHFIYFVVTTPGWQEKVQAEADHFMSKKDASFKDLEELHVIKKCINETLRLAPSVPNGSFREVQFDDEIEGVNGEKVVLKKGTPFVVPPWSLHHNAELWGDDVEEFNPDRKWLAEEDWFGANYKAYNPESHRYCPFTYGPRSCIGRPFAMMEARLILAALFHSFTFEIAEPTKSKKSFREISVNIGTLGPSDGLFVHATPRQRR